MLNITKHQDKEKQHFLAEINTVKFPITTLDKRHRHPIRVIWKSPDGSKEVKWELGGIGNRFPGPGALKVQRCLETKIRDLVRSGKLRLEHRRFEYSFYEILSELGLPDSGTHRRWLKSEIYDLLCLQIMTTNTIWDYAGGKYYEFIEPVRIYERGAFVGDIVNNNKVEKSFLEVSEWYLRNIIYGFTKPLLEFYKHLSPTAARLYEILSLHASDEGNILDTRIEADGKGGFMLRHISLDYGWLCERMPIAKQPDRYLAMKKLEKAHNELKRVGYIWEVELDEQWQLHYWLGREADREISERTDYKSRAKKQVKKVVESKGEEASEQQKVVKPELKDGRQIAVEVPAEKVVKFFKYKGPAGDVKVAGSFSGWQALEMGRVQDTWSLPVELDLGKHYYKFIIDGVWICDPENPLRECDATGNENSVLVIE